MEAKGSLKLLKDFIKDGFERGSNTEKDNRNGPMGLTTRAATMKGIEKGKDNFSTVGTQV